MARCPVSESQATPGVTVLDGAGLTIEQLLAPTATAPVVGEETLRRVAAAHHGLLIARAAGDVYGANTGVGANRSVKVSEDIGTVHGLRLLRSHCAAVGPVEDDSIVRAAMTIRLNQILAGGSGVSTEMTVGLLRALQVGALPTLHQTGAVGTADLPPLAELALTLIGERPWRVGNIAPIQLQVGDALPFISSSAVTVATAAAGQAAARELLAAAEVTAALSFLALQGSAQAWDRRVHTARPHPCQTEIADRLSLLIKPPNGQRTTPLRLQDPFGLRIVPQVHAPAVDAVRRLGASVKREMNAAGENPLVVAGGVLHHGQFHLATLAADLDQTRTTMLPVLSLAAGRLSLLMQPTLTGLPPFLSDASAGSSGLLITEYVAHDAFAEAQIHAAAPSSTTVNISLGLEEHATYATQKARHLPQLLEQGRLIVALEALAATRALQLAPGRLPACPAKTAFDVLVAELSADLTDRPLGGDIDATIRLLPTLAQLNR